MKFSSFPRVACVIPAYNEQHRIQGVIEPAVQSGLFAQVIVIDDGSTDYTSQVANMWTDVEVYRLLRNVGKSKAVARSFHRINHCQLVCLLDADLIGLTVKDLQRLVRPVTIGGFYASISSRPSYGGMFQPKLDIWSGERVVTLSLLEECRLEERDSFEMETMINGALIASNARIAVVDWPNVANPTKISKRGVLNGIKADWKMFNEIRRHGGFTCMVNQRRELQKQVVYETSA